MGLMRQRPVAYDTDAMELDAAAKGWNRLKLAEAARAKTPRGERPPHRATFYRFLDGDSTSPAVAKLIAEALGRDLNTYLRRMERRSRRDRRRRVQ